MHSCMNYESLMIVFVIGMKYHRNVY
ncbi:hypothetical protein F383_18361 [Gossypium arboreum]|uniref:Uncharacterized protein n=1 Tax=Gossypium arboreum TaxID=29729 RepID=A0A0B0NTF7_GOSAR|nr:hypothetical protein F383_18361 [Gossypium arboreum]